MLMHLLRYIFGRNEKPVYEVKPANIQHFNTSA